VSGPASPYCTVTRCNSIRALELARRRSNSQFPHGLPQSVAGTCVVESSGASAARCRVRDACHNVCLALPWAKVEHAAAIPAMSWANPGIGACRSHSWGFDVNFDCRSHDEPDRLPTGSWPQLLYASPFGRGKTLRLMTPGLTKVRLAERPLPDGTFRLRWNCWHP
jgi:hypothetical protein